MMARAHGVVAIVEIGRGLTTLAVGDLVVADDIGALIDILALIGGSGANCLSPRLMRRTAKKEAVPKDGQGSRKGEE
jgi:hypothetical protein